MNLLITYDIENNSLRTKIGKKLLYFGLARVQYSVYMGSLKPSIKAQLTLWLEDRELNDFGMSDKLLILPLHESLLAKLEILGLPPFDMAEVFGKRHTLMIQ